MKVKELIKDSLVSVFILSILTSLTYYFEGSSKFFIISFVLCISFFIIFIILSVIFFIFKKN